MQSQSLSSTQEQRQGVYLDQSTRLGISLLNKTLPEIEEIVAISLGENVFLETVGEEDDRASGSASGTLPDAEADADSSSDDPAWNYGESGYAFDSHVTHSRDDEECTFCLERCPAPETTLEDHVVRQIACTSSNPLVLKIVAFIAGNLDEDGYFRLPLREAADALGIDAGFFEKVRDMVLRCDPPGLGARNLRECLIAQLDSIDPDDVIAKGIVSDHLEDMACGKVHLIGRAMGVPDDAVRDAMARIRSLNPRPASGYEQHDAAHYVVPEVLVTCNDGSLEVGLRDTGMPRLAINDVYVNVLMGKKLEKGLSDYYKEQLNIARGLIKGIEERRATLLKTAACIVSLQKEYFEEGLSGLKPLTMKSVAEMIGVSHSTVSRIACNSYMETPMGVLPFKFFFSASSYSSRIKPVLFGWGDDDEDDAEEGAVSARYIKQLIKDMVEKEDKSKPLSDQSICSLLEKRGYGISRRTVNKYRTELSIPPRAHRRAAV